MRSTYTAMEELSRRVGGLGIEVTVMISPHTPPRRDTFTVKRGDELTGSFAPFGQPRIRISKRNDVELVEAVLREADARGLPLVSAQPEAGGWRGPAEELDHGLLVPLFFLDRVFETRVVCFSISALPYRDHRELGRTVAAACAELGRRALFVASGDLSHRLVKGASAGYSPRGRDFDARIAAIAASGNFAALNSIPEDLVQEAGECGFRSIHAMWGALENGSLSNELLSYEGPFGVGYLVSLHLKTD